MLAGMPYMKRLVVWITSGAAFASGQTTWTLDRNRIDITESLRNACDFIL